MFSLGCPGLGSGHRTERCFEHSAADAPAVAEPYGTSSWYQSLLHEPGRVLLRQLHHRGEL
jgi:hypothetical protein